MPLGKEEQMKTWRLIKTVLP